MTRKLYVLVALVASFTCVFYFLVLDRGSYHYPTESLREIPGNAVPLLNGKVGVPPGSPGNSVPLSNERAGVHSKSPGNVEPLSNDKGGMLPESSADGKKNPASSEIPKSSEIQGSLRDNIKAPQNILSSHNNEVSGVNRNARGVGLDVVVNQDGAKEEATETKELARHIFSNASASQKGSARADCPPEYKIEGADDIWFRTKVTQRSPLENITDERPYVVILTPISNSERSLQMYFNNLCSLDYPHDKISVVLGEDSSNDRTIDLTRKHVEKLKPYFRRIEFVQLRSFGTSISGSNRHAVQYQFVRRKHLAMSRNQLIFAGIRDEAWVLWIDSDVKHIPTNILERLLAVKKQIVVPNCLYRKDSGMTDTFDRNTWRETETSRKYLESVPGHFLMLEGYEPTKRRFLNDLKEEGDVVRLDGVGGCLLLVDADLHRTGLVFPAFTFEHHIETEGLSKMAAKMDVKLYGLPSVNVIHA